MPRARRRLPALVGTLATVASIGAALVAIGSYGNADPDIARELDALKRSSEQRERATGRETPAPGQPALCGELRSKQVGKIKDDSLVELSGLVQSRREARVLWAIQDSGAAAEFLALRSGGKLLGRWAVPGAENVDWEDIATGPGPGGGAWLYAADIGDNLRQREDIVLYRVPEPASPSGGGSTVPAQALRLTYPDGAHDAETLLIDPRRGTIAIVTKALPGAIYVASMPARWAGTAELRKIGDAPLAYATAGDVSANGTTISVRGYFNVASWQRRGDESLSRTLRRAPCTSPTPLDDGQGETLALAPGGREAWTVAEGRGEPIRRLRPR